MNNRVYEYLNSLNLGDRIIELVASTETVSLASDALDCRESEIAKTLSFLVPEPILVVTSGDVKIDNDKFRLNFNCKPKMIDKDDVLNVIGHPVGGVCPFNPNDDVKVYLDISLLKEKYCYPACGMSGTAIKLTIPELLKYTKYIKWVDVTKFNEVEDILL